MPNQDSRPVFRLYRRKHSGNALNEEEAVSEVDRIESFLVGKGWDAKLPMRYKGIYKSTMEGPNGEELFLGDGDGWEMNWDDSTTSDGTTHQEFKDAYNRHMMSSRREEEVKADKFNPVHNKLYLLGWRLRETYVTRVHPRTTVYDYEFGKGNYVLSFRAHDQERWTIIGPLSKKWNGNSYESMLARAAFIANGSEDKTAPKQRPLSALKQEKLKKVQALLDRATTPGEKAAAQAAKERIMASESVFEIGMILENLLN